MSCDSIQTTQYGLYLLVRLITSGGCNIWQNLLHLREDFKSFQEAPEDGGDAKCQTSSELK